MPVGRTRRDSAADPGRRGLPYPGRIVGRAAPDSAARAARPEPNIAIRRLDRGLAHDAALLLAALLLLAACSGDPGTGPVEVRWDRDVCARCNMVLSDRRHAAQVRHTPTDGGRSQLYRFDDIGCAVLWLAQQPWRDQPGVEIWVTDHRDGRWLDARQAHYVTGQLTPMQYGLGAQTQAGPDTLDFGAAREHIARVENEFNIHGGNLGHAAEAVRPPALASPERTASPSSR